MPLRLSIRLFLGFGAILSFAIAACSTPAPGVSGTPVSSSPAVITPFPSPSGGASDALPVNYFFRDDFNGGSLSTDRWLSGGQGGLVSVGNGALGLFDQGPQTSFPYVLGRQSIIPPQGPFFFELSYKVLQSVDGNGAALPSFSLSSSPVNVPASASLFLSTARFYNDLAITIGPGSSQRFLARGGFLPVGTPHLLRLEGDGLLGAYRLILDQSEVGRFTSQLRPQQLILGVYPTQVLASPIPWAGYAIDYVDSGVLTSPVPASPYPAP